MSASSWGMLVRRRLRAALVVAVLVSMVAGCGSEDDGKASDVGGQAQWRSYWVDSFDDAIWTPEGVDQVVEDAGAVHANVLIVQISRWMDCLCNRSAFPRTHEDIDPDFDPLEDIVEKGHEAGLQVHAWVNATPMWSATEPPEDPEHVFNTHGPKAKGTDRWLNKQVDGKERAGETLRVLDPGNPAATDYVVDGIASIVEEYDVDGINLDFVRYPDENNYEGRNYHSDWGYSATSLARFRDATGRTDKPAPGDAEFSDWRRTQLTNYVRKIYLTMYDIDDQAALSINGITYGDGPQTEGGWENTRTYSEVLQDWRGWLDEGIVDVNVAMNYKAANGQRREFDEWTETIADNQFGRLGVNGTALYVNSVGGNVAQIRRGLRPTAAGNEVAGWSGYSYAGPTAIGIADPAKADAQRTLLARRLTAPAGAKTLFDKPARVPELTWKTEPKTGNVQGTLTGKDDKPLDQEPVRLTNVETGKKVAERVTDGSGWFGFVDVKPGEWRVEAGERKDTVEVDAGETADADPS